LLVGLPGFSQSSRPLEGRDGACEICSSVSVDLARREASAVEHHLNR
jgi:hypothetical protein